MEEISEETDDAITPIKNPDLIKAIQSSELFKTLLSLLQNEVSQIKNDDLIKSIKDTEIFKVLLELLIARNANVSRLANNKLLKKIKSSDFFKKLIKLLRRMDFESKLSKINQNELIDNIKKTDAFNILKLIANDLADVPNVISQDDLNQMISSTEIYNKLLTLLENDFMTPIETREDYIKQVMNTEVFKTLYNQLFKK